MPQNFVNLIFEPFFRDTHWKNNLFVSSRKLSHLLQKLRETETAVGNFHLLLTAIYLVYSPPLAFFESSVIDILLFHYQIRSEIAVIEWQYFIYISSAISISVPLKWVNTSFAFVEEVLLN